MGILGKKGWDNNPRISGLLGSGWFKGSSARIENKALRGNEPISTYASHLSPKVGF